MCDVSQKWVEAILDFTYDQIDVDECAGARSFGSRQSRARLANGVRELRGVAEHWSSAFFEYWDGEVEPARAWQRAG